MEKPDFLEIPTTPGVYLFKDEQGRIIYIGKAKQLRKRVSSYFRDEAALTPKTRAMMRQAEDLSLLGAATENEALLMEAGLIKKHRPHYNILLRDDKDYAFFRLSDKHPFPRLEVVRKPGRNRSEGRLFGPYSFTGAAKETWKTIHQVFPLRRCTDRAFANRVRPCLYHHLGQCPAPCVLPVDPKEYAAMVEQVAMLLSGRSKVLLHDLRKRMLAASEALEFEKAATLRDQIAAIERTVERQSVVLAENVNLDALGVVEVEGGLALGLLFVREGRLLDGRNFFWPGLGLDEAPELLFSFLLQYYTGAEDLPPRIVIPWRPDCNGRTGAKASEAGEPEPADAPRPESGEDNSLEALEAALSGLRGDSLRIATARNKDEARLVSLAGSNAGEAAKSSGRASMPELLARRLGGATAIRLVEAVDVSHISGSSTRVGQVLFEDGKPRRDKWRAYAVEDSGGDDLAALTDWAVRRAAHGEWPDLLLIDGGRGQLAAVRRQLTESGAPDGLILAAIAKARTGDGLADRRAGNVSDRIFLPERSNPLPIRPGSPELLFLQHVRDTVHEFSLGRHRKARANRIFNGELARIPGIGPELAKQLWSRFGSLKGMADATPEALCAVPGIGSARAARLKEHLEGLATGQRWRK